MKIKVGGLALARVEIIAHTFAKYINCRSISCFFIWRLEIICEYSYLFQSIKQRKVTKKDIKNQKQCLVDSDYLCN